jgi:hypothetical protein
MPCSTPPVYPKRGKNSTTKKQTHTHISFFIKKTTTCLCIALRDRILCSFTPCAIVYHSPYSSSDFQHQPPSSLHFTTPTKVQLYANQTQLKIASLTQQLSNIQKTPELTQELLYILPSKISTISPPPTPHQKVVVSI